MEALAARVKAEGKSLVHALSASNEAVYLALLSMYVLVSLILKMEWSDGAAKGIGYLRFALVSIVMWGGVVYLFFTVVAWWKLWKNVLALVLIGAPLLAATWLFHRKMSNNAFGVVFDVYFCVMAIGKDYRKILRCILWPTLVVLALAYIGIHAGFTIDMQKPENISPGHSLGINYPNTWGYIAFLAMMLIWYLRLRNKPVLTFLFFWGVSAFMYFYISCRTIAVLTVVFPVFALFVDWIERRADKSSTKVGWFGWIVTALPFLAFAFMMYVSMQYKWVHKYLYPTALFTFAMRFVQGGLYFKTYGLPIFGNPYRSNQYTFVNVNGTFEKVGILDSSFAAYIIMRGLFWLTYTLSWLSFAIWKALRRRDYAIPFLTAIILVFAMMERPGLEMWYCFVLLYPLAK
ncbi:MAG: hypothetical protein ACSW8J_00260 [bacterium]